MTKTAALFSILCAALLLEPAGTHAAPLPWAPQVADTVFRHAIHAELSCLECHRMDADHGALVVRDAADCRSCHHVRERVERDCAACHAPSDLRNVVFPLQRGLRLSVHEDVSRREVRFDHGDHIERACAECHTEGPSFAVPDLDCGSCHEEHHDPTVSACMSCHVEPSAEEHTLAVHSTCSGSGCHTDPPFAAPPRTRTGCLWCHEDMIDHQPQGECVDCHFVDETPGTSPYIHPEANLDAHL